MQIIRNLQNINNQLSNTALTIGNFDGVHLGHQAILKKVNDIAKKENLTTSLLTFEPHPLKIINPTRPFNQRLFSLSQKLSSLEKSSLIKQIFLLKFNKNLANLSAENFVKDILVEKLKVKHLIIGYDFIFGKNRLGDVELLEKLAKNYGFSCTKMSAQKSTDRKIYSSTKIRQFILKGDILSANAMLGKNYQISGIVIKGKQLARNLGFPTANFLPKKDIIQPRFGVYKVNVIINNKTYPAIMNIGVKPTFSGFNPIFEVHIFNFNQDIYGKKITVELLEFIRQEKKFNGLGELKEQIKKDCEAVND
jgi:riboflavin kinase/FMN adenylyltransferase